MRELWPDNFITLSLRGFSLAAIGVVSIVHVLAAAGPTNLSIDEAVRASEERHPRLALERQKVEESRYGRDSLSRLLWPTLGTTAFYHRLSYVTPAKRRFLGDSSNDFYGALRIQQPLWTGGYLSSQEDAAELGFNAAEETYRLSAREVRFGVKAAYSRALQAQDVLRIKTEQAERLQAFLKVSEDLHRRTRLPREEALLRVRVQHQNAVQETLTAEEQRRAAKSDLAVAMGLPATDPNVLEAVLESPVTAVRSKPSEIPLKNHPEVKRLQWQTAQSDALVRQARSRYYPQIRAEADYGYEWAEIETGRSDWTAGVLLDWPLWDWGRRKALVQQASAGKNQLEESRRLTDLELERQWTNAWTRYTLAAERQALAQGTVDAAEKSLRLYERRYRDAVASNLEWLDAQQAWLQSQLNQAQARTDVFLADIEIERIEGRP